MLTAQRNAKDKLRQSLGQSLADRTGPHGTARHLSSPTTNLTVTMSIAQVSFRLQIKLIILLIKPLLVVSQRLTANCVRQIVR
jgi:hypothetical protein